MKSTLSIVLFACLGTAASAAPKEILIGKEGCGVVNPHPVDGESITWTGGCKDGYADGEGILEWLVEGKLNSHYEGTLVKGEEEGLGYTRRASGYEYEGSYKKGYAEGQGEAKFTS